MWISARVRLVLSAVSLLLNVFLVGIIAGHLLSARGAPVRKPDPALVPVAHVRALPDDERRSFNETMRSHRAAIRAARQAHRIARANIEAAIAAPIFDRDAVAAAFAALQQKNAAVQEAVNAALVDALQDLSPQSRASLVGHDAPR